MSRNSEIKFERKVRAARVGGMSAHARLETARELRRAAGTLDWLAKEEGLTGLSKMAGDLKRVARNLDAQRRRVMCAAERNGR